MRYSTVFIDAVQKKELRHKSGESIKMLKNYANSINLSSQMFANIL